MLSNWYIRGWILVFVGYCAFSVIGDNWDVRTWPLGGFIVFVAIAALVFYAAGACAEEEKQEERRLRKKVSETLGRYFKKPS